MKKTTFLLLISLSALSLSMPAQARVDSAVTNTFKTTGAPLDIAGSVNGKYIYVLTKGNVNIYTNDGKLEDSIAVDPSYDRISASGLDLANLEDKIFVSSSTSGNIQEISYTVIVNIDTTGAPFLGQADAPVSVVIFSDFQCPFCSKVGPLFNELLQKNPKTVKIFYKHFPIRGHEQAVPAANAAIAAQKQGKFWQYHDLLFQNNTNLRPEKYLEFASTLGLNLEQFKKDMNDPQDMAIISKDQQDGVNAGVKGTPSIFINGRTVKDRSVAGMQKMIDEELARAKGHGKK